MAVSFKSCSIDGCNKNAHGSAKGRKGFCRNHYERFLKTGNPMGGRERGALMRFVHEVALPYKGGECLIWPFGRVSDGRGSLRVDGRPVIASRYICTLVHGPAPSRKHQASHSCGNGHLACVTPGHLSWKTPTENNADKFIHGTISRGERHGKAKLTEQQVREIRGLKRLRSQREMARVYGVSKGTISSIHRGISWAWLDW